MSDDLHLVDSLQFDLAFEGAADHATAADFEHRLAGFVRTRAVAVVDAVFDRAVPLEQDWQLDHLELDLGRLVIGEGQAWEPAFERALRESLTRRLQALRDVPGAAGNALLPRSRGLAQLEQLFFFLRHGYMPWYERGRRLDDPRQLGRLLLARDGRAFARALRAAGDRGRLVRRLAAQFDDAWLADLLRILLPDHPSLAQRLVTTMARATRPGRAEVGSTVTRLWEATLETALTQADGGTPPELELELMRRQLRLALERASDADDDLLAMTVPAWRRLLRNDRAWIKSTLERGHRTGALQRRLADALPTDLLADLAGLWLAERQSGAVAAWIGAVAATGDTAARPRPDVRRDLWEAALGHLWAGGGEQRFDGLRFARAVRGRAGLAAHPFAQDDLRHDRLLIDPDGAPPSDLVPPDDGALRPGWETRMHGDPARLREAIQGALRRDEGAAHRFASTWSDAMLLEVACLQWPQARPVITATVASPPYDAAVRARRWAATLRQAFSTGARDRFDETAYLRSLVADAARHAHQATEESAREWYHAARDASAEPAWIGRIVAATAPAVAPPSAAVEAPVPAARPVIAWRPAPPTAAPATPAEGVQAARTFAHKLLDKLGRLAFSLGRRLGLRSSADCETPADAPIQVGNAGLVLVGPYLPRLLAAAGCVGPDGFVDDAARARGVHLLQYLVDGSAETAPESLLVLNKLLCGLLPATPVDRRLGPRENDRTLADALLTAVIKHWGALGHTSVAGLRETFLRRPGTLEPRQDGGGWALHVDAQPFDMLIDRLPWGYGMQKLPWMKETLHVQWR